MVRAAVDALSSGVQRVKVAPRPGLIRNPPTAQITQLELIQALIRVPRALRLGQLEGRDAACTAQLMVPLKPRTSS